MTGVVALVARREIDSRTRSRAFRISLLVALIVVGVGAALPGLLRGDDRPSYTVGTAAGQDPLRALVSAAADRTGADVDYRDVSSADAARTAVEAGDLDGAVVDGRVVAASADDGVVALLQGAAATLRTEESLQRAGLSAAQVQDALSVQPLPLTTVESGQQTERRVLATVIIVFFFAQLITFATWVGTGVVEEKTSRVVEVLLGAVRPLQLLAGKVLGIGVVAVGQAVLLGAVAMVAADLAGTLDVSPALYGTVALGFVWFVLGFAFFATLAAALASLVSHQEEVSGALTPMTLLLFVAYFGGFYAASNSDSTIATVFSFLPPFSALAMPGRTAAGTVAGWQVVVAMLLMIAATAGLLVVGARLYRASILHTGTKLSLAAAWRAEPVAR